MDWVEPPSQKGARFRWRSVLKNGWYCAFALAATEWERPTGRSPDVRLDLLARRVLGAGASVVGGGGRAVVFAFPEATPEAVVALLRAGEETARGEVPFSSAVSQGPGIPVRALGGLHFGETTARVTALATLARSGETLVDPALVDAGVFCTLGSRARKIDGVLVRGGRLDAGQPLPLLPSQRARRIKNPSFVTVGDIRALLAKPAALSILRANRGSGGTRVLAELAGQIAPVPSLLVTPAFSGLEPLGALRHAFLRAGGMQLATNVHDEALELEELLRGNGIAPEAAVNLVAKVLGAANQDGLRPALLLDDAENIDAATLDVLARAAITHRLNLVARLENDVHPPPALATMPQGALFTVGPLGPRRAETLVQNFVDGPLDEDARLRFVRRGGGQPLGIAEAIAHAFFSGGRSGGIPQRFSRNELSQPSVRWTRRRVRLEDETTCGILAILSLLGGQAELSLVEAVSAEIGHPAAARDAAIVRLRENRWMTVPKGGIVALRARSYLAVGAAIVSEEMRTKILDIAATRLLARPGALSRVEAAACLARSGNGRRAAEVALEASREVATVGLDPTPLVAFARTCDPTCEEEARRAILSSIPEPFSHPPAPVRRTTPPPSSDGDGPTLIQMAPVSHVPASPAAPRFLEPPARIDAARPEQRRMSNPFHDAIRTSPSGERPVPSVGRVEAPIEDGVALRKRLKRLVKESLLDADLVALERWIEALRASGGARTYIDRLRALACTRRGDTDEALRLLRRARSVVTAESGERVQVALTLALVLAQCGREQEALVEAMDALAAARRRDDAGGEQASLLVLGRLYAGVGREDAAAKLVDQGRKRARA